MLRSMQPNTYAEKCSNSHSLIFICWICVVSRNCSYISTNAPLYYLYFACSAGHCLTFLRRDSCIWIPLLLASKNYCLVFYPKLLKGQFSGFVYYKGLFLPFLAQNFDSTILSIPSLVAGVSSCPKIDLFLLFYYKGTLSFDLF